MVLVAGVIKAGMDHRIVMIIGVNHREDGMTMMMIGLTRDGVNHQDGIATHMIGVGDLVKPIREVEIGAGVALVRAERVAEDRGVMTGDGVQASLENLVVDGDGVQGKPARDLGVATIMDLERLGKDTEVTEVDGIVIIGMAEDGVVIR